MKQIITFLKQLDLSNTEIKIYIKLLSSGPLTVSELAEKIKMNRTAIYSYINSLKNTGLLSHSKGISSKFSACPPEQLYELVDYKLNKIKRIQDNLPTMVNEMYKILPKNTTKPVNEIKYHKGILGVRQIYRDVLNSNLLRTYVDYDAIMHSLPENDTLFTEKFKTNTSLKLYELVQDNRSTRSGNYNFIKLNKADPRFKYKILPAEIKLEATDTIIYDGKVAIININDRNDLSGVVITNQEYYKNSVQLFDLLWKLLPDPDTMQ